MSLRDHIETPQPHRGSKCAFGQLMKRLPDDELEYLTKVLADRNVTTASITRALRNEGYDIGASSTERHRGRLCRCEPR